MDLSQLVARNQREINALKAAQAQAGTSLYKKVYTGSITLSNSAFVSVQFASDDGLNPIGTLGVKITDNRSFDYSTAKFTCSPIIFQAVQMGTGSIGWSCEVDFGGAHGSITLDFQLIANKEGVLEVF